MTIQYFVLIQPVVPSMFILNQLFFSSRISNAAPGLIFLITSAEVVPDSLIFDSIDAYPVVPFIGNSK